MDKVLLDRLERLEAFEIARQEIQAYAQRVDASDLTGVCELFDTQATLNTPMGCFRGRPEIQSFFEQAWAADSSKKAHFIINQSLSYHGAGRVQGCSVLLYLGRGNSDSLLGWGRYQHSIDTQKSQGKISSLTIEIDLATSLSEGWALPNLDH